MNTETKKPEVSSRGTDANRDPITETPGAHLVGTGVGAGAPLIQIQNNNEIKYKI